RLAESQTSWTEKVKAVKGERTEEIKRKLAVKSKCHVDLNMCHAHALTRMVFLLSSVMTLTKPTRR
ncbi:hypothetical protein PanWU01x14_099070, partial [Parasponia andersonii]